MTNVAEHYPQKDVGSRAAVCASGRTDPALTAWNALSSQDISGTRVDVLKDHGKTQVIRMHGASRSGSPVIAKRTRTSTARIEQAVYERILCHLPVAASGWYGTICDNDEGYQWLFMEDVGDAPFDVNDASQRASFARWLATLHASSLPFVDSIALPDRGPAYFLGRLRFATHAIASSLDDVDADPRADGCLRRFLTRCEAVESFWPDVQVASSALPRTLVHGDLSAKNVRIVSGSDGISIRVIDWETAGWGTPLADCAEVDPDVYAAELSRMCSGVDASALPCLGVASRLLRVIECIAWASEGLNRLDGRAHALDQLVVYEPWLAEALAHFSSRRIPGVG